MGSENAKYSLDNLPPSAKTADIKTKQPLPTEQQRQEAIDRMTAKMKANAKEGKKN
jgi:hypothetical protein